jgi:hypothetical protein
MTAALLWLCTVLLFGRVIGQLVVAWRAPAWLPPMDQWQSGLLPYPVLVVAQAIVLTLMVWVSVDITRGDGFWLRRDVLRPELVAGFAYLYFGAMVVRYVVRMARRPDQRWFGGTIPIIFHSLVAAFLWMVAAALRASWAML